MAERRIAEKTKQGVVCFISNYSWLDGLSFPGMRQRYLDAFDIVRIDSLNGDRYRTGKLTPDGQPDPSIFSTPDDPVGIQVGTAIATLVRKAISTRARRRSNWRELWGVAKRAERLAHRRTSEPRAVVQQLNQRRNSACRLDPRSPSQSWFNMPIATWTVSSVVSWCEGRDAFVVDMIGVDILKARVGEYFDASVSHRRDRADYPDVMKAIDGSLPAKSERRCLMLVAAVLTQAGFIRCAYRPFDHRWLYWSEQHQAARSRSVPSIALTYSTATRGLVLQRKARPDLSPPLLISNLGDLNQIEQR